MAEAVPDPAAANVQPGQPVQQQPVPQQPVQPAPVQPAPAPAQQAAPAVAPAPPAAAVPGPPAEPEAPADPLAGKEQEIAELAGEIVKNSPILNKRQAAQYVDCAFAVAAEYIKRVAEESAAAAE